MERLSPQDVSFLNVENKFNHMSIAELAIFDGPGPGPKEIETMIASKLDLVPRYRQRLRVVPYELGRPVWCDDPHFSLDHHIHHRTLPAPGTDKQLQALVGRVMAQQLDRSRPLWEIWEVEGLEDGNWALLLKMHHCVADGVAATDLLSHLLDESSKHSYTAPKDWSPEPQPSSLQLTSSALIERWRSPREGLRALQSALDAPRQAARKTGDFLDGLLSFHISKLALESSLNGAVGTHRNYRWASASLADIKKIGSAHGGTVNDVVLTVISRGFQSLLLSRGEPVDDFAIRSLVPVSVRHEDEHDLVNNRVSAMFPVLPVGINDPVQRLVEISQQMNELKKHHQAVAGETLMSLSGIAPPVLMALGTRLFAGLEQHMVQTVITNIPGPRQPLYAAGRKMRSAYLYVPLAASVRIGVAIFSYAGQVTFAVTGDSDHAPDTSVLCKGIEDGIAELLATVLEPR